MGITGPRGSKLQVFVLGGHRPAAEARGDEVVSSLSARCVTDIRVSGVAAPAVSLAPRGLQWVKRPLTGVVDVFLAADLGGGGVDDFSSRSPPSQGVDLVPARRWHCLHVD